jgi:hypothetical protein
MRHKGNHIKKPDEVGEYHLIHIDIVFLTLLYCGFEEEYALTRALEIMRIPVQSYRDGLRKEISKNKERHLTYHLLFTSEENPKYEEADLLRMIYQRLRLSGKLNLKALWVEQNSPFLVVQKLFKIHKKLREEILYELDYEDDAFLIDYDKTLELSRILWERISAVDMKELTIPQRLGLKRKILNEINLDNNVFLTQDVANDCYVCEFVKGNSFEVNCNSCFLFKKDEQCKKGFNEYTNWLSTGSKRYSIDMLYKIERLQRRIVFRECKDTLFIDALVDFYVRHGRDEFIYLNTDSLGDLKCVRKYLESFGHRVRVKLSNESYYLQVTLRRR